MGFHQYIKAYRKDDRDYIYWQDDGRRVTLVAGKDGVTKEWIARLKMWHIEERNSMRRGEGRTVSLEAFCQALDDCSEMLMDASGDPAEWIVRKIERETQRNRLRMVLKRLAPQQRTLLIRIKVRGESFASIAREEGVSEAAVRKRLRKLILSIGKLRN